jgi:2-amino-4-hydroxy-6-hydroxymethyldihydropteridine diphosphokinase
MINNKMHKVLLSLAANCYQKSNLAKARQCLGEVISNVNYTSEQWTEPVSSLRHDLYLNQLAEGTTELGIEELSLRLKAIELSFGRTAQKRKLGIVPIDLDILEYDGQRYHERDWQRPYVATLIGQLQHDEL